MVTPAGSVDGKGSVTMDNNLVPNEVKSLITVLKGQIFLLGKDWDSLLEPEKKELSMSAVQTITELNDLVRGKPDGAPLKVVG